MKYMNNHLETKEPCFHEVLVPTEFGAECQVCGEYPYEDEEE